MTAGIMNGDTRMNEIEIISTSAVNTHTISIYVCEIKKPV